jgi:serine O-acetyltransferase
LKTASRKSVNRFDGFLTRPGKKGFPKRPEKNGGCMNNTIKADLFRYGGLSGLQGFLKGLTIPGFRYSFLLRKAAAHPKYSLRGICYRLLLRRYSFKYGFQIPVATRIGKGLYIGHFGTIIINSKVTIGQFCNIGPGVTIGQENRGIRKGNPTIRDQVWIGANAVIVGKIEIGRNVLITPTTFVNFDVPENSIVIGNPARIIPRENPTQDYINHLLEA